MSAERLADDEVGQRLAKVLDTEANTIKVGDAWEAIGRRLLDSDQPSARPIPVRTTRRAVRWRTELTTLGLRAPECGRRTATMS